MNKYFQNTILIYISNTFFESILFCIFKLYFFASILFCIFKILFKSILPNTGFIGRRAANAGDALFSTTPLHIIHFAEILADMGAADFVCGRIRFCRYGLLCSRNWPFSSWKRGQYGCCRISLRPNWIWPIWFVADMLTDPHTWQISVTNHSVFSRVSGQSHLNFHSWFNSK